MVVVRKQVQTEQHSAGWKPGSSVAHVGLPHLQVFSWWKIMLHHLTSIQHVPPVCTKLLHFQWKKKKKSSICKIWIIRPHGTFHRTKGKWWQHWGGQNDIATLPPSGDKNGCTVRLYASCSSLNSATLLTGELKANLQSVAQLDVQP